MVECVKSGRKFLHQNNELQKNKFQVVSIKTPRVISINIIQTEVKKSRQSPRKHRR
jgi:hypothetical protein